MAKAPPMTISRMRFSFSIGRLTMEPSRHDTVLLRSLQNASAYRSRRLCRRPRPCTRRDKVRGRKCLARPRSFDEAATRELAGREFWARKYEATSLRDLEAAAGLGMTSLYNAFGGKRELFRSALEHYAEYRTRNCLREIKRLPSPADRIRTFVSGLI